MIAAICLLGFAGVLGSVVAPRLCEAGWPVRSPALGILAWQILTASMFTSIVLAGLALAVPAVSMHRDLGMFFQACAATIKQIYATPLGAALSAAGGALAVGLVVRFLVVLARVASRTRRDRARQHDLLSLLCCPHAEPNVVIVEHDAAAVYCLPGRHRRIVVTRGALEALSSDELDQVLRHERRHLRAHHDVALLVANALAATFSEKWGFGVARTRIAELAEMHADDATDASMRGKLASALVVLASGEHPIGALGASGGSAVARLERLAAPAAPITGRQRHGVVAGMVLAVAAPILIVFAPGFSATLLDYCPTLLG